ncbi:lipopolysaccharide biosynthesis protein [Roseibium aggregatum]|uniref:lipopolysaccharide biosynthesis protein n=1 Tax=Roseibium aggregatum TaxID=187304 RepID=UPI003A9782F1
MPDIAKEANEKPKAKKAESALKKVEGEPVPNKKGSKAPIIPFKGNLAKGGLKWSVDALPRRAKNKNLFVKISFVLAVILPTIIGGIYYLLIASDRYAASAGFTVRSMDNTSAGTDFLGSLSGLSSVGTTATDSYIILEYLKSRELLESLGKNISFTEVFGKDSVDFRYRLEPNVSAEELLAYWDWMIKPTYDASSGIMTFEVQAFTPEDAERIANLILGYCQSLINDLSKKARNDALKYAEQEVSLAEVRLESIRAQMRSFRETNKAVDPAASAAAQIELSTEIEKSLIEQRARLSTLQASLDEDAPSVLQLKKQISSLEQQLTMKKSEVSDLNRGEVNRFDASLSALLADYESLEVDKEFAERTYAAALASLERARVEAQRQQRFLAIFRTPKMPEEAIYPARIINTGLVFFVSFLLWSIGTLLTFSVRDHLS